ncbi:MAG: hypothetical protein H0V40_06580, partial [Actinobacteria bacterium]|nr:hypothetical protein [Actinomycetota bacterium]
MTIAYIVLAHKNPRQVARLVHALADEDAAFYLHVDSKTPPTEYRELVAGVEDIGDLHHLPRVRTHWGGFGLVEATLAGIERIAARRPVPSYTVLLTGQDYPIKSRRFIREFFEAHDGSSFVHYAPLPWQAWGPDGGFSRIESWHWPQRFLGRHLSFPNKHVRVPLRRRFPRGLHPFGGYQHWCLARRSVEYLAAAVEERPDVVSFFRHVYIPDETLIPTLLLNSPLRDTITRDDLKLVRWGEDRRIPHPRVLTAEDFDDIASAPDLYARKFDTALDARILDLIDERL